MRQKNYFFKPEPDFPNERNIMLTWNRKKLTIAGGLLLFFLLCGNCFGQIVMKIELPQKTFLQYEPIYAKVHMRNLAGHTLAFGASKGLAGRLHFEIGSDISNSYASLIGDFPTTTGIILPPGVTKSFVYNISAYYKLPKNGQYSIKAIISHPQMRNKYQSNRLLFSVTEGTVVWQSTVGIPTLAGEKRKDTIDLRKYTIRTYFNGRNSVYMLYVEDDKKVYSARRMGYDLGNTLRPRCAVDDMSNLHILIAGSPRIYSYCKIDTNGKILTGEIRIKTDTTPELLVNRELGTVLLRGGRKANPETDYEEIKDIPFTHGFLESGKKSVTRGRSLLDDDDDDDDDIKNIPSGKKNKTAPPSRKK